MGTLYIVATPIGNLEDVTLRALRVLKEVEVILCEDTRVTKRLLEKYKITGKQLFAYNEQKSGVTAEKVIALLEEGKDIALVSDAGTPGISDPGAHLIEQIRTHLNMSTSDVDGDGCGVIKIEAVPGPSALTAALSIAGVPVHDFVFLGFLPHKKGRETLFKEIAQSKRAVIFYESPHRILKTLESLQKRLEGNKDSTSPSDGEVESFRQRQVVICRELTKIHEEVKSGTATELLEYFRNNPEKVRGEFVVIVRAG